MTQLNSDRDTAKTHREDRQGINQRHKMATSLDVPVAEPYGHIVGVSAQLMGVENRYYSMHTFYFVNCVIISCKLSFNSRFTRNQSPIMLLLGFKKAELGCKMSDLHLYVVKRQNWVVIIRK